MDFLYFLSGLRSGWLDTFFSNITYFGSEIIVIGIICILFWCYDKKLAYKIGFIFFASGILVQGLKITFRIDRPWLLDPDFKPVQSAVKGATGYSFPSGHSQSATALYGTLVYESKKTWIKIAAAVFLILVPLSRLYLGVHTPADVITSISISAIMIVIFELLYKKIADNISHDLVIAVVIALVSAAVMIYSIILMNSGLIAENYVSDCCKAAASGCGFAVGWYIERRYIQYNPRGLSFWKQVLKFFVGITIALVIKEGIKAINQSIATDIIRYFILVLWVLAAYPALIKRYTSKKIV